MVQREKSSRKLGGVALGGQEGEKDPEEKVVMGGQRCIRKPCKEFYEL